MTRRLRRIEVLILSLTTLVAAGAAWSGSVRPLGVVLGGMAALVDFEAIRRLGAIALARRPGLQHVLPLALLKSGALLMVPALALLLPARLVDGVSFAIGVTSLPLAVVLDAFLPLPASRGGRI